MLFMDRLNGFRKDTAQQKESGHLTRIPISSLVLSVFLFLGATESSASGLDESLPITNGTVYDIAVDETTVYVAGDFTRMGTIVGNGVVLDSITGNRLDGFPEVAGAVYTVIPDGQDPNGWYIAGSFSSVGGEDQPSIAHILPDKTLDPIFNPFADSDGDGLPEVAGYINSLALDGDVLYIGGYFSVRDPATGGLVSIDTTTGAINSSWLPNPLIGETATGIDAMVLSGSTLYVSGPFTSIGEQTIGGIVALETLADNPESTGTADPSWNPSPLGSILAMVSSDGYIYVAGIFSSIGGQIRSSIAAIEALDSGDGTGRANTTWDPNVTGVSVGSLLLSGDSLYVSGTFTDIGGQARSNIAVVDAVNAGDGTGRADALWDPDIVAGVTSSRMTMVIDEANKRLYVGGDFSEVGGVSRNSIAAIDAIGGGDGTGSLYETWDPDPNHPVFSLALSKDAGALYVGGLFTGFFDITRNRIAAFDKATGILSDWNPGADDRVRSLVLSGTTLYAGGVFTAIGGQPRNRIAALDTTADTNSATTWDPDADAGIIDMILNGTTIYVAGDFTQIGGRTRYNIAALDALSDTDNATNWNPGADGAVYTMLLDDTTLYVGGEFAQIGGGARNRLGALNTTVDTDNATSWNPNVAFSDGEESVVKSLALSAETLYVGGEFDTIGGSERNNIAAIDTETDTENATSWDPNLDGAVNAMHITGSSLYVAGGFNWSGGDGISDENDPDGIDRGIFRSGFVVLDIASDALRVRSWNPSFGDSVTGNDEIFAVVRDGLDLYAGGTFDNVLQRGRSNLVRVNLTPPTVTIDLDGGTYPKEQFVWVACEPGEGFQCETGYFTLDGTDPTPSSEIIAAGGIYIESTATVKVLLTDNAGVESAIVTENYVIDSEDVVCFIDTASDGNWVTRFADVARRVGLGLTSQLP